MLYGNIGGGNRLDFTCIGPAVNLAARMEKIAGRLSRTVVASAAFANGLRGGLGGSRGIPDRRIFQGRAGARIARRDAAGVKRK